MLAIVIIAIIIGIFIQPQQLTTNHTTTTTSSSTASAGGEQNRHDDDRHHHHINHNENLSKKSSNTYHDADYSPSKNVHAESKQGGDSDEKISMMHPIDAPADEQQHSWNTSTDLMDPSLTQGSDQCTIEQIREEDMTSKRFATEYWRRKPVILLRKNETNIVAQRMTLKHVLLEKFGEKQIPLAKLESYAFRDEQYGTLRDYINNIHKQGIPNNTTRFAFSSDQFQEVGDVYIVPNTMSEIHNLLHPSFQVAIAGSGTGLSFHWHGDVWAETLHGARRWLLFPPHTSPPFNPRMTSAEWIREIRPKLFREANQQQANNEELKHISAIKLAFQECTLKQNEAIYVPAEWFHATLSLGEAVSITTSYASTFRRDRYHMKHGTSDHAHMIDSFGSQDFVKAHKYAEQLRQYRPNSFVPYGWLGVILTMDAKTQHVGSLTEFQNAVKLAHSATLKCIELNPYYCPCHVWANRQLKALIALQEQFHSSEDTDKKKITSSGSNQQLLLQMLQQAQMHAEMAEKLSSIVDDEILDPRWQPKYMTAAAASRRKKATDSTTAP